MAPFMSAAAATSEPDPERRVASPAPVELVKQIGLKARCSAAGMSSASPAAKALALGRMADALLAKRGDLLSANGRDLAAAKAAGLSPAMLDRLELNEKRIAAMAAGLREVAALPDPVGEMVEMKVRPNGLRVGRMLAPLGVVAIVYESRPNVTADAAALCLKGGNSCVLRGGKEAIESNRAIAEILRAELAPAGLPGEAIQLVQTTDRAVVAALVAEPRAIDVVIPRGGRGLVEAILEHARVPVLKHLDGNCHVYVDRAADLAKAEAIAINSKTQRTGVCNAAETLLLDEALPADFIAGLLRKLQALKVELRGCERTQALGQGVIAATSDDWRAEYLDLILAVKIVAGIDEAVGHINAYGSKHTDAIVSDNYSACQQFVRQVDSACVHVNCSTRFSDGGEYGLGCEIGISTDKLHARGPMGVRELTCAKWVVLGEGQIRG
jgi:glutamate-5-semialdehyde dehydrogenase